ncbi:PbpA [Desulfobacter hydrogenophilus]|uniref:PbpA n=1 Tax=Desulfobacter hydrogenophilus TaxID=2291 RepID=A0A328FET8_9BACT|nr:penicillin-binding transpeptidase domain-containing protein [Desulfobacter hydrogenophilus]NDY70895.1 PbpA [Desulfobacter hydrogenophilus]QBH11664.1 PbpA [Desulfobacter hydrogenophilus]RAM03211.1 PbpA [Desulfobacter hydrogenophilus]
MDSIKTEQSWREFQASYIQQKKKRSMADRIRKIAVFLCLGAAACALIWFGAYAVSKIGDWLFSPKPEKVASEPAPPKYLGISEVKTLVQNIDILNAKTDLFFADGPSWTYTIHTKLDTRLQAQLISTLNYLQTLDRGKPELIGMVAMDGSTGFIKAMAGFNPGKQGTNPCTSAVYPAASLFKIVTASAAVEKLNYTATTPLFFNGRKYTLYKQQLTNQTTKYTSRVTLETAFAESINPVFGKLGQLPLGKEVLNNFAEKFGFNQNPDADFNFPAPYFSATDSDYHLAELGCGFNRDTLISPVFAMTMVSAVVNKGHSLVPRLVDRIANSDEDEIYKSAKKIYKTPISAKTAATMKRLMKKTVSSGTARKSFRGYSRDKVLSNLLIGGKTGSLSNREHTLKYDWFTGFGQQKTTKETLIVAVVVGHGKYIGTRACIHAKNMLRTYFSAPKTQKSSLTSTSAVPE